VIRTRCSQAVLNECGCILKESERQTRLVLNECGSATGLVLNPTRLCSQLPTPSVYFLVRYLPFWNGTDVLGQLLSPACGINILHYPPIYSFLARLPFVNAANVEPESRKR